MRRIAATLGALVIAATTVVGQGIGGAAPACDQRGLSFGAPVKLGTVGKGYEPGIEIDSAGTVFVTAHKLSLAKEETGAQTRLSSFLWRSTDAGASFHEIGGPAGIGKYPWAFEGDLAVDALDRLYYVDTWAGDEHFYRYSDHGETLDLYRPAIPSGGADDRPWLAAHQDGAVYYMFNTVNPRARQVVQRSLDGGLTWDLGLELPNSIWGFIDADPTSDHVYAVTNEYADPSDPLQGSLALDAGKIVAWVSANQGETWTRVDIADYEFGFDVTDGHDDGFSPIVAVSPVDGEVAVLWGDDGRKLKLALSGDHGTTWTVQDVTPFPGVFSYPWVTFGPTGDVGISFAAHPAALSGGVNWIYGMVWRPTSDCLMDPSDDASLCTGPTAAFARADALHVSGYSSQADFFQLEMDAADRVNVVWTGRNNIITYAKQASGPNMDGAPSCGVIGSV